MIRMPWRMKANIFEHHRRIRGRSLYQIVRCQRKFYFAQGLILFLMVWVLMIKMVRRWITIIKSNMTFMEIEVHFRFIIPFRIIKLTFAYASYDYSTVEYNAEGDLLYYETDDDVFDGENSATYVLTTEVNADGRVVQSNHDLNNDGTIDTYVYVEYDAEGNVSLYSYDDDADGTIDATKAYTYDKYHRLISTVIDDDNDGTMDSASSYSYQDSGYRDTTESDLDNDGVVDLQSYYFIIPMDTQRFCIKKWKRKITS